MKSIRGKYQLKIGVIMLLLLFLICGCNDNNIHSIKYIEKHAYWYFEQIPDHLPKNKVNFSTFTQEFKEIIYESFYLDSIYQEHGFLDGEAIYYWYNGQDDSDSNSMFDIKCITYSNDNAMLQISSKYDIINVHILQLAWENNQWLINNWDQKKEELKENNQLLRNHLQSLLEIEY